MTHTLKKREKAVLLAILFASVLLVSCRGEGRMGEGLPPEEAAAAVRLALTQPSHFERISQLAGALSHINTENLPAVFAVASEQMAGLSQSEVRLLISSWSRIDPASAFAYADSIPFETQRREALGTATFEWARVDLAAARRGMENLPEGGRFRVERPEGSLVRGWAYTPDSGLEAYILERPERDDLLSAVIQEKYRRLGPEKLTEWADSLIEKESTPEFRRKIFRKVARTIGYRKAASAIPWVLANFSEEGIGRDGPLILVESWSQTKPLEAIEWLRTDAPEASRSTGLQSAYRQWLGRNRQEARRWLASMPDDPFYFSAYAALAKKNARDREFDEAAKHCQRISPSELKDDCLYAVATLWYKADPLEAGLWMEESSIDPGIREKVRLSVQRVRPRKG